MVGSSRRGIHGRQQEQAPGRRLLQQLEQRVGRFLTRLLRHQPLGVAEDEDPAPALDRRERRPPLEQPNRGHRVARHPVGRPVAAACARRSSITSAMAWAASSTALSGSAALGRGIGTNQCRSGWPSPSTSRQAPAPAAGLRASALTEDQLGEPERQPLLPDPGGPGDDDHLGQPSAFGPRQPGGCGRARDRSWVAATWTKVRSAGEKGSYAV